MQFFQLHSTNQFLQQFPSLKKMKTVQFLSFDIPTK